MLSKTANQIKINHQHPRQLYLLSFAEFWDRFSYYGIQSLLVIYLTKHFLFSDNNAYGIYGAYTAMTFAIPVIGGFLADKILGLSRSVISGALLIALGNILLSLSTLHFTYSGLAFVIAGIGLFKPCNATMVGTLYEKNAGGRDGGFTIFYIGMNCGALLGPLIYGFLSIRYGIACGFIASAVGMLLTTLLLIYKYSNLTKVSTLADKFQRSKKIIVYPLLIVLGILFFTILFALLLEYTTVFSKLLNGFGLLTLLYLCWIAFSSNRQEAVRIITSLALMIFSLVFFACSLQTATSLLLFLDRVIDRHVFGWQIPSMMFLSVSPAFIIIMAPIMAKYWAKLSTTSKEPSVLKKISLGLLCAAIAFGVFSLSGYLKFSNHSIPLLLIVLGNFLLGLGELCILPVLMSAISYLSPVRLKAMMMGVLFLSLAFSGYFAGLIAKLTSPQNNISQNQTALHLIGSHYAHIFIEIGLLALLISIIGFLLTPLISHITNPHANH